MIGLCAGGVGGSVGNGGDSTDGSVAGLPLTAEVYARGRGEPEGGAGSGKDVRYIFNPLTH